MKSNRELLTEAASILGDIEAHTGMLPAERFVDACLVLAEIRDAISASSHDRDAMDNDTLLRYLESHCETDLALTHKNHLKRLYTLAGEIPSVNLDEREFWSAHADAVKPLVERARRKTNVVTSADSDHRIIFARDLRDAVKTLIAKADEATRWMSHATVHGGHAVDRDCNSIENGPDTCSCGSDADRRAYYNTRDRVLELLDTTETSVGERDNRTRSIADAEIKQVALPPKPSWEPIGCGPPLELDHAGRMLDPTGWWAWNGDDWISACTEIQSKLLSAERLVADLSVKKYDANAWHCEAVNRFGDNHEETRIALSEYQKINEQWIDAVDLLRITRENTQRRI